MNQEMRLHKLRLLAKDYPVRIKTADGKYLITAFTFQKDQYGMPIHYRETHLQFDTLADAVECGIRWKEARYI